MALSGIDTSEYGAKAMERLRGVIEANQKATEQQTQTTIRLNRIMVFLSVIVAILTALTAYPVMAEIWSAVRPWRSAACSWLFASWLPAVCSWLGEAAHARYSGFLL